MSIFKWLFINRSIRTKIVWSSVLISLVPMLVLSYLFYQSSTRSLEDTMYRSADQNAVYLSSNMNQYFKDLSASALQVYGFNRVVSLMEHGANYYDAELINVRESLANYNLLVVNKNKDIIKIMIYGKDNQLRDSWSRAASYDAIQLESIAHSATMLDMPFQSALMLTYYDPSIQQDLFVYAMTIYDPFYRTKIGSLIFFIKKKELSKMIEQNNRPPNIIALQNAYGETFYETSGAYASVVPKYTPPQTRKVKNDPRSIHFVNHKDLLVGQSYLDNGNISLSVIYPNDGLAQNRQNTLLITLGALGFAMLSISILSLLVHHYITRPIKLLGKAMKAVRLGNFHLSLHQPNRYRDDISELIKNFNFMTEKIRELIDSRYKLQLHNKEAQIMALQMQINPHFLNNTLQTIGGKAVLMGDYEIHEMCRALGDMFRYSFYEGNTEATIGQELAHVNNYLYIQQFRFEESLRTAFDIPADLMDVSIIRFVMQPVIENIFVHGTCVRDDHVLSIAIAAAAVEQDVLLTIRDNGPGIEAVKLARLKAELAQNSSEVFSGLSIGLKNVHERIRLVYGTEYGLDIDSESGKGTCVRIRIPYRKKGEKHVVQSNGR
ncbi:sensor histidine kinase [Paenibacillaceae bacterium]|nr:sensor histidine kinase [Paenibacillaceae bacterium]